MTTETKSIELKNSSGTNSSPSFSLATVNGFAQDVKDEVKKITWTSKDELFFYTKLVVGATLVVGMSIYLLDLVIQTSFVTLNLLLRLITN